MSTEGMSVSASSGSSAQIAPQSRPMPQADAVASRQVDIAVPKKAELSLNPDEKGRVLKEAIAEMNRQMEAQGRSLGFAIDKVANRTVITVHSKSTGEVVRQIPDTSVLAVAHNIEAMRGLMLDEKA